MMTRATIKACSIVTGLALVQATPASAGSLSFDCDVPPDKYSSVTNESEGRLGVAGVIDTKNFRSGNNLPVAGARLVSANEHDSVGFQLIADSPRAKSLDLVFNVTTNKNLQSAKIDVVDLDKPIEFSLSVSADDIANLMINGKSYNVRFVSVSSGKEMVFCSTGQFKFSKFVFLDQPTAALPR